MIAIMSKKKKYILIGIGVIVLISLLTNVGGGDDVVTEPKKDVVMKVAQTEIKGDLKGCYEVVDKNYKVKFAKESYERDVVTVELKRTSKELPYDRKDVVIFPEGEKSSAGNCAGFGIEILDADGEVIDKINANATPYSWDEMTAALQLLADETSTIGFHFSDLSEAVSFRITSLVQDNEAGRTTMETDVQTLVDVANKAKKISDEVDLDAWADVAKETAKLSDEVDWEEAQEDAEKTLKMAGETMELAGKMLDMLGN